MICMFGAMCVSTCVLMLQWCLQAVSQSKHLIRRTRGVILCVLATADNETIMLECHLC